MSTMTFLIRRLALGWACALTVLLKLAGGLQVELPELLRHTLKRYETEKRVSRRTKRAAAQAD